MDSFMSEPPMSLQPQFSSCAARLGPIFTHDACMSSMTVKKVTFSGM